MSPTTKVTCAARVNVYFTPPFVNRPALLIGLLCQCLVRRLWFGYGLFTFVLWCCVCVLALDGVVCVVLCVFFLCCLLLRLVSFWQRSPLVLGCPLGLSGQVSFLLVPPSGYLIVSCNAHGGMEWCDSDPVAPLLDSPSAREQQSLRT